MEPSAKDKQTNQIKTNFDISSNKSNLSKKSNQSIKAHTWPKGSCLVIGDLMLEGLDERKMSSKRVVKVRKFPGATTDDMYHYLMPLLQKQPDNVILHVETNDASSCNSSGIVRSYLKIAKCDVILWETTIRSDTATGKAAIRKVSK